METLELVSVRLPNNALDLSGETEIRRRFLSRVHLQVLRDRVDAVAEHVQ